MSDDAAELQDAKEGKNIRVVYTEHSEDQQKSLLDICVNALKTQEKSDVTMYQKDVAETIKKELDSTRGGTWNVIVGQSFGSFVSHESKSMAQFFIGNVAFLVWKHG